MNTIDERIRGLVSQLSESPSNIELATITKKVARHQRRRKIGVIGGALAAGVLSIAGLASAIGGSGPSFHPSGNDWVTFSNPANGFAISYPSSWSRADSILTTHVPQELVALGSFPLPASTGSGCAQFPEQALRAVGPRNALVLVWELPPVDSGVSSLPPRPPVFTPSTGISPDDSPQCVGGSITFDHWLIAFQDKGRQFEAFVAVGKQAPSTTSDQAWEVLNTMTIAPSPTPSPTSQGHTSGSAGADAAAMAKDLGISTEEAKAALKLQPEVGDLQGALSKRTDITFGGMFISYGPYQINILTLPGTSADVKTAVSATVSDLHASELTPYIHVVETEFTEPVLLEARADIVKLDTNGVLTSSDIDIPTGRVILTAATSEDVAALRAIVDSTQLPIPGDHVDIQVGRNINQ